MKWPKIKQDIKLFCNEILYWKIFFPYVEKPCSRTHDFFRYEIPQGIGKLIEWFPIIWNDRHWDFCFLEIIIKFKLERMANSLEKYGHSEDNMKNVRQMRACIKLLEKIREDEFGYMLEHEKKWGELKMSFESAYHHETGEQEEGMCLSVFERKNARTPQERLLETEEWHAVYDKENKARDNTYKALFLIMSKRIRYWWD